MARGASWPGARPRRARAPRRVDGLAVRDGRRHGARPASAGLSGIGWWFLRLHDRRDPVAADDADAVDSGSRGGVGSAHRSALTCNQEVAACRSVDTSKPNAPPRRPARREGASARTLRRRRRAARRGRSGDRSPTRSASRADVPSRLLRRVPRRCRFTRRRSTDWSCSTSTRSSDWLLDRGRRHRRPRAAQGRDGAARATATSSGSTRTRGRPGSGIAVRRGAVPDAATSREPATSRRRLRRDVRRRDGRVLRGQSPAAAAAPGEPTALTRARRGTAAAPRRVSAAG